MDHPLINSTIQPLTVAGIVLTDQYHISNLTLPHAVIKDIVYPYSVGRQYMIVGAEHDDNTTLSVTFSESGQNMNRLYASSYQEYWTLLCNLAAAIKATPVCSVSCLLFTEMNMRVEFILLDAPKVFALSGVQCVGQPFELKAARYAG